MPVLKYLDPIAKLWRPVAGVASTLAYTPRNIGAEVGLTSPQGSNAGWTDVVFAGPIRASGVAISGNEFIVSEAGWYAMQFWGNFESEAHTVALMAPRINGAIKDHSGGTGGGASAVAASYDSASFLYWLNPNDRVGFSIYQPIRFMYWYGTRAAIALVGGPKGDPGPPGPPHTLIGMELGQPLVFNVTEGTYTAVPLSSAPVVRNDGGMSVVADGFVVPVDGWYTADCSVTIPSGDDSYRVLTLEHTRGSTKATKRWNYSSNQYTGDSARSVGGTIYCLAGDRFSFEIMHTGGTNQTLGMTFRGASCVLVGGPRGPVGPPGTVSATSGIQFPAVQSPSNDPNTFDDFKEGDWTPAFIGSTSGTGVMNSANSKGRYTKMGRRVFIHGSAYGTKGTVSGGVRIGGLPYPVANVTGLWASFAIGYCAGIAGWVSGYVPMLYADPGLSSLGLVFMSNAATTTMGSVSDASLGAHNTHIIFHGHYDTDA